MNKLNMRRTLAGSPTLRMKDGGGLGTLDRHTNDRQQAYERANAGVGAINHITSDAPTFFQSAGNYAQRGAVGLGNKLGLGMTMPQDVQERFMKQNLVNHPGQLAQPAVQAAPVVEAPQVDFQGGGTGAGPNQTMATRLRTGMSTPASYTGAVGGGRGLGPTPDPRMLGLRDGGPSPVYQDGMGGKVPGPAEGDKFNAKYEGGEIVVSNAMKEEAGPQLESYLHELREGVLAEKGMTPEEADAKAVSGKTLRAVDGISRWDQQTELDRAQRTVAARGPVAPLANHEARVSSGLGNISAGATPQVGTSDMRPERGLAGISPGVETAPVRGTEDFSKALSSVPNALPTGLRDNMVYKTKGANGETVYSGRNVTGDVSGSMLRGDGTSAGPMRGSVRTFAGAPNFVGDTGGYVVDDQAPTGAAKQGQINSTLRSRPAMSADGPGMQGIQARQDGRMSGLRQQSQYDQEVAAADKINAAGRRMNLEYGARRGNTQDARTLRDMNRADAAEKTNALVARGQDLQYEVGMAGAAGKAGNPNAQANEDRKYQLDVARLGLETANKQRDDKRAEDKALDERVVGMTSPEAAPAVLASINGWLASRQAQLEAEIKANPNDPKNENRQGQINSIRDKGRGSLDDAALRKLVTGFNANSIAKQGSGMNNPFNPWDGTSANTNQPVTSLTPDTSFTSRFLPGASKYVTDNGQKILASDVDKNPDLRELLRQGTR
jgi:hypothetical protein